MRQRQEVFLKLAEVYDPELDQSVTEMGFIDQVGIEDTTVTVYFRLPTYWCSPNFAYIMAEDMRDRILELPWVTQVVISLKDHCASEEVNKGVTTGRSFSEMFSGLSGGDLEKLRQTFRIKTFVSREERLLRHLMALGVEAEKLVAMTMSQLLALPDLGDDGRNLRDRYFSSRTEMGFHNGPEEVAFLQSNGETIDSSQFSEYLIESRRTRLSMEFNANHCRGLLETRYAEDMRKELEVS